MLVHETSSVYYILGWLQNESQHMTHWPVQKQVHRTAQKHTEHQDATDIQEEKLMLLSFFFRIFLSSPLFSRINGTVQLFKFPQFEVSCSI